MLNPSFGEASGLVGGADADLIIDERLIEIKTTTRWSFPRRTFDQLLGYHILMHIGGVDGVPDLPTIETYGIYYSRHARLYTFPVREVMDEERFPAAVEWFEQTARKGFQR